MAQDLRGGTDYALVRRHYDNDDYVSLIDPATGLVLLNGIPFTQVEDYYVVGTMAYLHDPTVADVLKGWTPFAHGQTAPPTFLAAILTALGVAWPAQVPAFEAKDILFLSDQDCWVRFGGPTRVRHFIPANQFIRFHRRCFMIFVQRVAVNGTLRVWMEG